MAGGGDLYLQTENMRLDEKCVRPHGAAPGRYVKVSVTDTGVGMDEETLGKIFDPFFTTKEMGRGTGLGLASVFGIVKNHNGFINAYSEVGEGTTFNIYLPASDREVRPEPRPAARPVKGSETILLVDDEDLILEVGRELLKELGYRVVVAGSGQKALDLVADLGEELHLVILDLIMPGLDGGQTFDRIRELKPGIPVILSSGYSLNGQATDIMDRGCDGFIQKPYSLARLSRKIRQVLERTS